MCISKPAKERIRKSIKTTIKRILTLMGVQKYRSFLRLEALTQKMASVFSKFQEQHIPSSSRIYMTLQQLLSTPPAEWSVYDYAVTGSDQVWSLWTHTQEQADYYYLSFMPQEKRVCYAPSFGFSEFYEPDIDLHRKGLTGFTRLSCREQEMIPMIERISGKSPQLVLDPTLLLNASQWRTYASKPDYNVPEKFVLCYFLGTKTPEYIAAIHEVSGGLPVISIYDPDNKAHLLTDPGAFLWLIDHADFVCTDSFHGIAFSVNFGKNFLAFKRKQIGFEKMFGRISGLLDSLNITGHVYESGMHTRPDPVNYDEAYSRLDALRESSMNYLRDCLHVN